MLNARSTAPWTMASYSLMVSVMALPGIAKPIP